MIWVGSFRSLQSVLEESHLTCSPLEVHTWAPTDISLISPLVDWLMDLIAESGCVRGQELYVELALREALSNAMLHGNRLNAHKLVQVRYCCECNEGVSIVVRDQGEGFDPDQLPSPLAPENLAAAHGRGIHLMQLAMDEISFERRGTQVHLRKMPERKHRAPCRCHHDVPHWLVRPSPRGFSCRIVPILAPGRRQPRPSRARLLVT